MASNASGNTTQAGANSGAAPPTSSSPAGAVGKDTHSTRVDVINTQHGGTILCVSDIRGAISTLNKLAAEHSAVAIIHSGDFGFYEPSSLPSISDRTLRHLVQYSSLIPPAFRSALLAPNIQPSQMREMLASPPMKLPGNTPGPTVGDPSYFALSEFPKLLSGEIKLLVPVYTVWGACEDVAILEKIRLAAPSFLNVPSSSEELKELTQGEGPSGKSNLTTSYGYSIPNLTVLDEATTRVLLIGGIRLRLFGLGGAVVSHKLFDNGTGNATIAGGGGTMWTTVLQIGELVDTAQKVYDATETRLLVSHASPGREGLLAQLALVLKADLTVSAGLHFRYGVSYNEFSVQHDPEAFRHKLEYAKKGFNEVWETVKTQVESVVDSNQRVLLNNALAVANRVPASVPNGPGGASPEETAWKNCWNWNLPDAAYGSLLLDIREGRVGSEMRSQGFNFAYRQHKTTTPAPAQTSKANEVAPVPVKAAETGATPPAPTPAADSSAPSANANAAPANVAPQSQQNQPPRLGPPPSRGGFNGPNPGRGNFQHNGRFPSNGSGGRGGRSSGQWNTGRDGAAAEEKSGNENRGHSGQVKKDTGSGTEKAGEELSPTNSTGPASGKEPNSAATGSKPHHKPHNSGNGSASEGRGGGRAGRGAKGGGHRAFGSGNGSGGKYSSNGSNNAAPSPSSPAPTASTNVNATTLSDAPAATGGRETPAKNESKSESATATTGENASSPAGATPTTERGGRGGLRGRGGRGGRGAGRGNHGGDRSGGEGATPGNRGGRGGKGHAGGEGWEASPAATAGNKGEGWDSPAAAAGNTGDGWEVSPAAAAGNGGKSRKAGANGGGW